MKTRPENGPPSGAGEVPVGPVGRKPGDSRSNLPVVQAFDAKDGSAVGTAYQTAKAGLIGLTRSLALSGAPHGIVVNAIMPTAFTRMTAGVPDPAFRDFMERTFTPERVAALTVLLASDDIEVSGECFLVGGGRIARAFLGVTAGYISDDPTPEEAAKAEHDPRLKAEAAADPNIGVLRGGGLPVIQGGEMVATVAVSGCFNLNTCTTFRIGARGLRSSWPRIARNSFLRRSTS